MSVRKQYTTSRCGQTNIKWWFSLGTLASSTTKAGRHDIAEILLKVALNTKNKINTNKA
jgi:hypothetical protein